VVSRISLSQNSALSAIPLKLKYGVELRSVTGASRSLLTPLSQI
jgi:hypothetical protein